MMYATRLAFFKANVLWNFTLMQIYTVLSVVWILRTAECYSSGLVSDGCGDMTPLHSGSNTQPEPAPYFVVSDRTSYKFGDEISVTLQSNGSPFVGFLLQARSDGGGSPIGTFTVSDGRVRLLACSGVQNTAVAHTSAVSKTSIVVKWKAPQTGNLKDVTFSATFVKSFSVYWVEVKSNLINYDGKLDPAYSPAVPNSVSSASYTMTPLSSLITSTGCGNRKLCLSRPNICDPAVSTDCHFMSVVMSLNDSAVQLEISGPSEGYISIGFSDDREMGNDDIYICGRDSSGLIKVQHAFSTGKTQPNIISQENISDIKTSALNGIIQCSFTSQNSISTQRSAGISPLYYLLFAYGATGNGIIQFHTDTFISGQKVNLAKAEIVETEGAQEPALQAHGSLMLIAWMTTGSLGMIIARYLKTFTREKSYHGRDLWFLIHVFLMSVTVFVTTIAFILVFAYERKWSGGAHPVLGCLVMIMAFIQPLAAIFRCAPDHKLRMVFNWSHRLNAMVIKVLSVAAIFTGLSLLSSSSELWLQKVMGGFVGWEALFFILQELNLQWGQKDDGDSVLKSIHAEVILLLLFFIGNLVFLLALLSGIGMP